MCLRLNRLSRKPSDLLHNAEVFDKQGIALRSLTEDFQRTHRWANSRWDA
ncbi:recombinase family protein [Paenibacillus tuaregi]